MYAMLCYACGDDVGDAICVTVSKCRREALEGHGGRSAKMVRKLQQLALESDAVLQPELA